MNIPDLELLDAQMRSDYRSIKQALVCTTPGHDMTACSECHDRLRRIRAAMQDGVVACAACGDLGFLLGKEGPSRCAAGPCWARRQAAAAIERGRRKAVGDAR